MSGDPFCPTHGFAPCRCREFPVVPAAMVPWTPPEDEGGISRELIKAVAMEIGKSAIAHVEMMYPDAIKAATSTFKLSLRNHIYNDIMAIADIQTEGAMKINLSDREANRKELLRMYRKMRRAKSAPK